MFFFLIIGDSHVPRRAKEIPNEIRNKIIELSGEKLFDSTFFTGDLIKYPELIDLLKSKTKIHLYIVIGNMDYYNGNRDASIYQKLDVSFLDNDKMIIGLTHGSQIQPRGDRSQLESLALEKNFNILISGHTHKEDIFLSKNGILLLNPGSSTGAWSFIASGIPSFIVLEIQDKTKEIKVSLFQLDKKTKEINELKSFYVFKKGRIYKKL